MKPLRPAEPKAPLYADDINAERAEVDRLGKLSIDGPAGTELQTSSTGMQVTVPAGFVGCWAQVTTGGTTGGPWAWQEMRAVAGGQFETKNPGRSGTQVKDPLYHPGGEAVSDGAIVFIMKGAPRSDGQFVQQDWLIVTGAGTGVKLCRVWGTPDRGKFYPCKFNIYQESPFDFWIEGTTGQTYDCWLIQRFSFALTVGTAGTGGGCYFGVPNGENHQGPIGETTFDLPIYMTTQYPTLDGNCMIVN